MDLHFSKLTKNTETFFNILPKDWSNLIAPNWENYKKTASIYVITEAKIIVAGGIVFSEKIKEMTPFEFQYEHLFKEGYLYLGYIFVSEEHRNKKLATKWLTYLKENNKHQKYWLTIEEEGLKYFYEKNNFTLLAESKDSQTKEWILTFKPTTL